MKAKLSRIHLSAIAAVLALCAIGTARADTESDAEQRAQKLAIETCSACHGAGGISTSPTFPILAAQNRDYLVAQLTAFREHTRGEPAAHDFMYGMARSLDDATIHALAHFFSDQKPAAGRPGDSGLIARGKQIFTEGDTANGVIACSLCHGPDGHGNGAIPRLAGQHADYVLKQLLLIQNALRSVPAMHGLVRSLKPEDMRAIAEYVRSLN